MNYQRTGQKLVLKNEAVDAIVRVLDARDFNDPRKLDDRALPLRDYVVAEVGRSFDRVRLTIPDDHPLMPSRVTAAAMRQQGKLWLRWPIALIKLILKRPKPNMAGSS